MRFRLSTPHVIADAQLPAGTEIGDGTPYPIPPGWKPTPDCEPLDEDAKAMLKEMAEDMPPVDPALVPHRESTVRPGFAQVAVSAEDQQKLKEAALRDDEEHDVALARPEETHRVGVGGPVPVVPRAVAQPMDQEEAKAANRTMARPEDVKDTSHLPHVAPSVQPPKHVDEDAKKAAEQPVFDPKAKPEPSGDGGKASPDIHKGVSSSPSPKKG